MQGLEVYKGKIIAYSLGNFVFGTRNDKAAEGLVLRLEFEEGRPPRAEAFPVLVQSSRTGYQPRPLSRPALNASLKRLKRQCAALGSAARVRKDRLVLP
jgi:poly-gamma-glutamate capsule biosynthesis protein CapA/YwtB (metallophosphatase superfamily)